MITLIGALVGLGIAGGIALVVAGIVGVDTSSWASSKRSFDWDEIGWRLLVAVLAPLGSWLVFGWPALGAFVAAVAWTGPRLLGARRRRDALLARTEAVAAWTEMLRDTLSAQAGLREAIAVSAPVAPRAIRAEVQELAVRCERDSVPAALRGLAFALSDPVADLVVAALIIAAERQARDLASLLGQIASSAREQSAMRLRVETGRARTYATSRWMVIITAGTGLSMLLAAPKFMKPYGTTTGQLVLIGIAMLFGGALSGLVSLGKPAQVPRLLSALDAP